MKLQKKYFKMRNIRKEWTVHTENKKKQLQYFLTN